MARVTFRNGFTHQRYESVFSAVHGIVTLGLEEKLGAVSLEELRN